MDRGISRPHVLIGAAALLCLLVAPIAVAESVGGSEGPQATASGVKKQVKKLKKKVKNLQQQVEDIELAAQGPPGPQGEQGPRGEQGPPGQPGQNATKLFAYIRDPESGASAANVQYGSGVTAVSDTAGPGGNYEVTFNRSLVNCVVHADVGFGHPRAGGNAFPLSIPLVIVGGSGSDDDVSVSFRNVDFAPQSVEVDTSFMITAFC